jgi:hypothetical protein
VTNDADQLRVPVNGSSNLTWRSDGADTCTSSGGWSGGRSLSGTYQTGPLTQDTIYRINCQNGSANAVASVTIGVGSDTREAVVRWQAPTRNTDGSNLTDLAGYVVYWGRQSRNYTSSQRLNDSNATVWRRDLAADRYVIAMTAVDNQGNESSYSNEIVLDLR